ncbi:MAG: AraC family transcriptional regulator ligand-binding domain-containing protein, partial [SAR324 cluster bacterium]|nr:AraC family transcriptional regulator ligand-binding domain-containing protein [SAR324 cluster bacterium]
MARNVLEVAVQAGAERRRLLAAAGLDERIFDDPDQRVPATAHEALFEAALRLTGDAALGLHVGERTRVNTLHVVGYAAMNSANLGTAIDRMAAYGRLISELPSHIEQMNGNAVAVNFGSLRVGSRILRQDAEYITGGWLTFFRWITGKPIAPAEVHYPFPAPPYLSEYERIFRSPVRFGESGTRLVLDRKLLKLPLVQPNPKLLAFFDEIAQEALAHFSDEEELVERVRRVIADRLCRQNPTLENVARQLATSPRTLQRRLRDAGVTFVKILDDTRRMLC